MGNGVRYTKIGEIFERSKVNVRPWKLEWTYQSCPDFTLELIANLDGDEWYSTSKQVSRCRCKLKD